MSKSDRVPVWASNTCSGFMVAWSNRVIFVVKRTISKCHLNTFYTGKYIKGYFIKKKISGRRGTPFQFFDGSLKALNLSGEN